MHSLIHSRVPLTTQSAFWVSRLSVSIELYGCTTTSLKSSYIIKNIVSISKAPNFK